MSPPPAAYNTVQNFDRRGRTRQILSTAVLQPTNFFCVFSECNCHGKAEECYFNQTVADLSLSLDIHGQYKGGGVCIGCRDDTAGINCQSCVPGFYRPADVRNLAYACVRTLPKLLLFEHVCVLYLSRWALRRRTPASPAPATHMVPSAKRVSQIRDKLCPVCTQFDLYFLSGNVTFRLVLSEDHLSPNIGIILAPQWICMQTFRACTHFTF